LELTVDSAENDDESLIGEACHIVAESPQGARGKSSLTPEQRDKYNNLILLCAVHHKVVDDQHATYSVAELKRMKSEHEAWVKATLSFDPIRQREEEVCASYIDEWSQQADLTSWRGWTSWLLSPQPSMSRSMFTGLQRLRDWLLSRIWPQLCPKVQQSLLNFRLVLNDFLLVFSEHSEDHREDMLITAKFYKINQWDEKLYKELGDRYDRHVDLIQDLVLELTRAANYVCDMVRLELFQSFRLQEGALLVERGPDMSLRTQILRPEYRGGERTELPYRGLNSFKKDCFGRDFCISEQ
jgi:hypothetical protein